MLDEFTGLKSTFFAAETGCVGDEFTPGDERVGTFVSGAGISGLPVMRSSTYVMPYLLTYATAGRETCFVTVLVTFLYLTLPWTLTLTFEVTFVLTAKVPWNMTPLFGKSESQRSWCAVWKYHFMLPVFRSSPTIESVYRLLPGQRVFHGSG